MRNNVIAVDMGSSSTAIYQVGTGVVLYEPSVVALSTDAKRRVKEVGKDAKSLIGRTSDSTVVLSPIFESEIEDESAATAMCERFLNKVTLRKLSARPQVIFSVPCGIELPAIRKFEKMLIACDVSNYSFVEAPILAAIGMQIPIADSSPCFVVDIGGGSTDIAAVSLDGVICGVNVNMGGISIDAMMQSFVEERFGLLIGALTAEKLKISIGSLIDGENTQMVINGRDVETGRPRAQKVDASEISQPIHIFFDKIFQIMGMVMAKLPAEVSADIRKNGVYFSGGVSKTAGLEDYFRLSMGIRANVCENPELSVIVGGGTVAANKTLLEKLRINKR